MEYFGMSELLKLNVSDYVEKKNGLSYLSWAHAWAEVLKLDPQATWEAVEFNGLPVAILPDESAMVKVLVTIKGHTKSCWLPVMNHRNQAIKGPDAFAINTAIVRCLTKAISMHGLGLYIYAGEDLPEQEKTELKEVKKQGGLAGIGDDLSEDWKTYLEDTAKLVTDLVAKGDMEGANFEKFREPLDDVQQLYMERFLDSKTRAAMRKFNEKKAA
jgi:hypothetical protein